MDIQTLLSEEIVAEFDEVKTLKIGSDEHKTAVDSLTKLVDRAIEMEKFSVENEEKIKHREDENDLKFKQMEDERKDRIVKNMLTGVSVVGGFALTVWGTIKSIEFEKDGAITTIMGRGFINKLLHK